MQPFPHALSGSPLRQTALAMATGALLALGSGAAFAVDTTFTGFTDGCFGLSCMPTPSNAPTSVTLSGSGLTFTNSTFSVTSAGGMAAIGSAPGTPNVDNLGSFTLTGAPFTYTGSHFDLLVSFTAPPGTTPGSVLVTDALTGTVASTDNGGVFLDFDNTPKHFTFGSGPTAGSFDFTVNDVSVTAGQSIAVTGTILVGPSVVVVASVPEPGTYALLLAGLGVLGFVARRRKF